MISTGLCLYTYMYIVLIDYRLHESTFAYWKFTIRNTFIINISQGQTYTFQFSGLFWILVTFNLLFEYRIIYLVYYWLKIKTSVVQYTSSARKELGITHLDNVG